MGQAVRAWTVGRDDSLADAPPTQAGQQVGDRQVKGAAQTQEHR